MKRIELEKFHIKITKKEILIIAKQYDSCMRSDEELNDTLLRGKIEGELIFDNVLVNGGTIKSNRFGKKYFEEGKWNTKKTVLINKRKEVPKELLNNKYYKRNPKILENSILTCRQKDELLTNSI